MNHHPLDATASAIFTANNAATRRTPPPRTPEAKLSKKGKGKEAKLAYTGNVMTENRNGFVVEAELRQVSGIVERETAKDMVVRYSPGAKRITVGADKGFDTADFVADMRDFNVTPHVAQNTTNRLSAIDHRTTRHCGYEISQQKRKRVEEPFDWGKTIGGLARPLLRGVKKLDFKFTLTMAAYDLIKLPRLIERQLEERHAGPNRQGCHTPKSTISTKQLGAFGPIFSSLLGLNKRDQWD